MSPDDEIVIELHFASVPFDRQGLVSHEDAAGLKEHTKELFVTKSAAQLTPDKHKRHQVLMLHGKAFSATIWKTTRTHSALGHAGYTAYGVDLPGFARSVGTQLPESLKGPFVQWMVGNFAITSPVVVCPSMSTPYCISYAASAPPTLAGLVIVGPVGSYPADVLAKITVPVLFVAGGEDIPGQDAGESMRELLVSSKKAELVVIKGASHPCHVDQPELFNTILITFLHSLDT